MNYQPKAGRCRACTKLWEDCSALPFHTMPVHSQDGTDAVVICTGHIKSAAPICRTTHKPIDQCPCLRCNPPPEQQPCSEP